MRSGSLVSRSPSCQIQCVSIAVISPRRGGGDVGEHRERDVEVIVRMRAPGEAPVAARLRDAHRAAKRPEMRVGERDVDRLQGERVGELAPVGGDHVGRRRQAGRAAELGHHLAAGKAAFGAARVLGVGEHVVPSRIRRDRLGERPAAVRIERDARLGKALVQGGDRLDLGVAGEHAALQLEVDEAVARLRRLGEADDRRGVERRLVAQRAASRRRRRRLRAIAAGRSSLRSPT